MKSFLLLAALSSGCGGSTSTDPTVTEIRGDATDETARSDVKAPVDSETSADTSADATVDSDSGSSDASACTGLGVGAPVTIVSVADVPPVLKGGTIIDGVYEVISGIDYTGTGGASGAMATVRRTLRLAGTAYEVAKRDGDSAEERFSGSFKTSGTSTFEQTNLCPTAEKVATSPYEATATTFKIFVGGGPGTRLVVMTRR
jgi:hypothetical protein